MVGHVSLGLLKIGKQHAEADIYFRLQLLFFRDTLRSREVYILFVHMHFHS